jgi:hypothetical protein
VAELRQMHPKTLQEIATTFVRPYRQLLQRPGTEQIITPALGARSATVEQHAAWGMADRREVIGGVGAVRQRVYEAGWHGRGESAVQAGERL